MPSASGSIIVAEMREITSAPNGCCMFRIELHRRRLARLEVEQRRDDRRRAEVERDREAACRRVAGLDVDQHVVDEDGGDLPVGARSVRAERAQDLERDAQLDVVHRRSTRSRSEV